MADDRGVRDTLFVRQHKIQVFLWRFQRVHATEQRLTGALFNPEAFGASPAILVADPAIVKRKCVDHAVAGKEMVFVLRWHLGVRTVAVKCPVQVFGYLAFNNQIRRSTLGRERLIITL